MLKNSFHNDRYADCKKQKKNAASLDFSRVEIF